MPTKPPPPPPSSLSPSKPSRSTDEDASTQTPGVESVTDYSSNGGGFGVSSSSSDSESSYDLYQKSDPFKKKHNKYPSSYTTADISTKAETEALTELDELDISDIRLGFDDSDESDSELWLNSYNTTIDNNNVSQSDATLSSTATSKSSNKALFGTTSQTQFLPNGKAPVLTVVGLFGRAPKPDIQGLPENYTENDMKPNQFMCRRRLHTKPLSDNQHDNQQEEDQEHRTPYDNAMFVPVRGLIDEHNTFWHISYYSKSGMFDDRAILFQSIENYNTIQTKSHFANNTDNSTSTPCQNYLENPYFGEQIIVQGLETNEMCIGDIFQVVNGLSPLVVEITAPRKPCYYVDKRNGTTLGPKGMKRYTLNTGLAGWFTRVLVAGELRDGMKLIRTKCPNPKWTLEYCCKVLYTEGSKMGVMACRPQWAREKEELIEFINLRQLGDFEWKADAKNLLKKMEDKEREEAEKNASRFHFLWKSKDPSPPPELQMTVKGIYGQPSNNSQDEDEVMERSRYTKHEWQPVFFAPTRGIMYETFWHTTEEKINGGKLHGDRAVLFQSVEHYELLINDPLFSDCFSGEKSGTITDGQERNYMSKPTFGEQVIVHGCDASSIAIGDVFEVEGDESDLVFEVSAPRKAGAMIDIKHHGRVMNKDENGLKDHCLKHGFAGWFTRVLTAGELKDDMVLVRTKHPNPKWTLSFLSNMMYSDGDEPTWNGTKEELIEFINLKQIGDVHWKDEGKKLRKKMKAEEKLKMNTTAEVEEENRSGMLGRFFSLATGATFCYCDGMESLMNCATGNDFD